MNNDEYLTASEIARMLGLTRNSVYSMRRRGVIPQGRKIGGIRRWNASEIREFLKGGEEA